MTDVEFAVSYLTAWAWQKARRIGGLADPAPDPEMQAGLDRLHTVVTAELAGEPALGRLLLEAASDLAAPAVRSLTTEHVRLALQNAIEDDPGSAVRLHGLVTHLRAATARERLRETVSVSTSADRSIAMGGAPLPG
jgi:hypothetical protein